jgi:hypothetical protein
MSKIKNNQEFLYPFFQKIYGILLIALTKSARGRGKEDQ